MFFKFIIKSFLILSIALFINTCSLLGDLSVPPLPFNPKFTFVTFLDHATFPALRSPKSIVISSDNKYLYVASQDASATKAVQMFKKDSSGWTQEGLSAAQKTIAISNVEQLAISEDGTTFFAASSDHKLHVYTRDTSTGTLDTSTGTSSSPSVITPTARSAQSIKKIISFNNAFNNDEVYVAGDGKLGFFEKRNGVWGQDSVLTDGANVGGGITVNGLAGSDGLVISVDGKYVYAVGTKIVVASRLSLTGALTFVESIAEGDSFGAKTVSGLGTNPKDIAITNDGKHVYVASGTSGSVLVFERHAHLGYLNYKVTYTMGDANLGKDAAGETIPDMWQPVGVAVSQDGIFVYVTAQGSSSLVVFLRNTTTGELTFLTKIKDGETSEGQTVGGLNGTGKVTEGPDKNLYVIGQNGIVVIKREDY